MPLEPRRCIRRLVGSVSERSRFSLAKPKARPLPTATVAGKGDKPPPLPPALVLGAVVGRIGILRPRFGGARATTGDVNPGYGEDGEDDEDDSGGDEGATEEEPV